MVPKVGDSLTSDMQRGIGYGTDTCWSNPEGKPNTLPEAPTYEIRGPEGLLRIVQTIV